MPYAVAAGISVAGGIGSALIGANASEKASKQQAFAEQQALDLQKHQFATTQQNVQPYVSSGQNALLQLQQLLGLSGQPGGPQAANPILRMLGLGGPGQSTGIDPSTFTGSPGYQYQLQSGLDAVKNSNTLGPGGGNALLALQRTGQGLANQNWNQYLSNASSAWQQMLGNVGGVATTGLNAASALAGDSQSFANAAGNNLTGQGNALAAGTMGGANALAGGINSGINNINSLLTNPQAMDAIRGWLNSSNPTGVGNLASTPNPFGDISSDASNPKTYG